MIAAVIKQPSRNGECPNDRNTDQRRTSAAIFTNRRNPATARQPIPVRTSLLTSLGSHQSDTLGANKKEVRLTNAEERLFGDKLYPRTDTGQNLNRCRNGDATRNVERQEYVRTSVLSCVETLPSKFLDRINYNKKDQFQERDIRVRNGEKRRTVRRPDCKTQMRRYYSQCREKRQRAYKRRVPMASENGEERKHKRAATRWALNARLGVFCRCDWNYEGGRGTDLDDHTATKVVERMQGQKQSIIPDEWRESIQKKQHRTQ